MFREALVECSSLRIDWEVEWMVDNLLSPDLWYENKMWPSRDFRLSRF